MPIYQKFKDIDSTNLPTFLNPYNSLTTTPPLPSPLDQSWSNHPLHTSLTLEYVERPILLVLVLESAGRGRTAGERLEKRRKCRFPREQKLPEARSAVRFISARRSIHGGRRSLSRRWSFAGGRCTRSPNADYALFILYKREQPCTRLPQFVRTRSRDTPERQSRGFRWERGRSICRHFDRLNLTLESLGQGFRLSTPTNLSSPRRCRVQEAVLATWGIR